MTMYRRQTLIWPLKESMCQDKTHHMTWHTMYPENINRPSQFSALTLQQVKRQIFSNCLYSFMTSTLFQWIPFTSLQTSLEITWYILFMAMENIILGGRSRKKWAFAHICHTGHPLLKFDCLAAHLVSVLWEHEMTTCDSSLCKFQNEPHKKNPPRH